MPTPCTVKACDRFHIVHVLRRSDRLGPRLRLPTRAAALRRRALRYRRPRSGDTPSMKLVAIDRTTAGIRGPSPTLARFRKASGRKGPVCGKATDTFWCSLGVLLRTVGFFAQVGPGPCFSVVESCHRPSLAMPWPIIGHAELALRV